MRLSKVLILGKLPPPYMGPAIATKILLNSGLKNHFDLIHIDTRINTSLISMGKWSLKKIFRNIRIYLKLFRINIVQRPELVLIPVSQSGMGFLKDFISIIICKLTGRKVLLQLRGSNFRNWMDASSGWMKVIIKTALKWSEGMIVLGNNLLYLFSGIVPVKKIYVVPNGGNFYFPLLEKKGTETRYLFLSNLFDAKGIRDVMDAIVLLHQRHPGNFHVDIAGSWLEEETRMYCLGLAEANGLPVSFHPPVSAKEKQDLFSAADVFIFTPREPEGHPWVIIEAMAAALPVIATDQGAISESVIDGENGFVVGVKKPAEIAEKMESLMTDSILRLKMGKKSLDFYHEKFTEEKMVENYVKCFNAVLGNDRNG